MLEKLNIFRRLTQLETKVTAMVENQAQLDATIQALQTQVTATVTAIQQVNTDWETLKAKLAGSPDFTNEVNALQASMTQLQNATTTATTTDSEINSQ